MLQCGKSHEHSILLLLVSKLTRLYLKTITKGFQINFNYFFIDTETESLLLSLSFEFYPIWKSSMKVCISCLECSSRNSIKTYREWPFTNKKLKKYADLLRRLLNQTINFALYCLGVNENRILEISKSICKSTDILISKVYHTRKTFRHLSMKYLFILSYEREIVILLIKLLIWDADFL